MSQAGGSIYHVKKGEIKIPKHWLTYGFTQKERNKDNVDLQYYACNLLRKKPSLNNILKHTNQNFKTRSIWQTIMFYNVLYSENCTFYLKIRINMNVMNIAANTFLRTEYCCQMFPVNAVF